MAEHSSTPSEAASPASKNGRQAHPRGHDATLIPGQTLFSFGTKDSGTNYAVVVSTQPSTPAQSCTVTPNGMGTIGGAHIPDIAVTCTTTSFKVRGTATGTIPAGVVLQNSGPDDLALATGAFAFSASVKSGAPYSVRVKSSRCGGTNCAKQSPLYCFQQ